MSDIKFKDVQVVVIGTSMVTGKEIIYLTLIPSVTDEQIANNVHLELAKCNAQAGAITPVSAFDYNMLLNSSAV